MKRGKQLGWREGSNWDEEREATGMEISVALSETNCGLVTN